MLDDPTLAEIAEAHGRTAGQVMLRWHLQIGNMVFPKSVTRERIVENFAIFDFELSGEELERIESLDAGERIGPHRTRSWRPEPEPGEARANLGQVVDPAPETPSLYEWAGGRDALERLLDRFYDAVERDELLSPFFPGGVSAEHRANVATWWCEVLGGPADYTARLGGYESMLALIETWR